MMKKMVLSAVLLCALAPLFAQGPMQNLPKMSESVLKETLETLVYSVKDGQELLMDKYVDPAVPYDGDRPVLIYAFGGGFAMGSRSSAFQIPYYKHFVDRGFVVLAIDYRLGVKAPEGGKVEDLPVPEGYETRFDYAVRIACEDMIDATAYVVAHADEWGVDPTKIILSGSSAGAMTSLNAAYEVAGEREFASRLPEDFNYGGVIPSLSGRRHPAPYSSSMVPTTRPCLSTPGRRADAGATVRTICMSSSPSWASHTGSTRRRARTTS